MPRRGRPGEPPRPPTPPEDASAFLDLAEVAASADPLPRRAGESLRVLRRVVPFDGAWLALADPYHPSYTTLASADLADSTVTFLAGPLMAHDMMRSLAVAASLVKGAIAGLVLWADGESATLPGLADHPLLAVGSAVPA